MERLASPRLVPLVLAGAMWIAWVPVLAQLPPGAQAPTVEEQEIWAAKLMRLQNNTTQMPTGIADAIASLSGTVTKMINCPEGSKVSMVTINIRTTLVRWDPKLAVPNSAGTYFWGAASTIRDGKKTVTCTNWVMLDPAVTAADEAGDVLDQIADEGLAYHELLHGQLLINAMTTDAAWQQKLCGCVFDLGPADGGHTQVDPAVDGYLTNRAQGTATVNVVRPPKQSASGDGSFDIELADAVKETFTWKVRFPGEGGNIDPDSLKVEVVDGKFRVKGKLIDKTKPGRFFLRIDPPTQWLIAGIEEAVVVLPASVLAIPTLGVVGLLALVLGLFAAGWWRLRRRRIAVG